MNKTVGSDSCRKPVLSICFFTPLANQHLQRIDDTCRARTKSMTNEIKGFESCVVGFPVSARSKDLFAGGSQDRATHNH